MEAKAAEERGHRLRAQAQLAQAADAYNEALSAWVSPQEPDREAVCRLRLGDVLRMMGRLDEAEVQYEKARGIHQARGNALGIADAIECQGDLTRAAGRWDRALELYGVARRPGSTRTFRMGLLG
jgi:tetratricopeptide (TPR) repeat protein